MFLTTCGLRIWFSRGKWLDKWWRVAAFSLVLAVTTILRHNAVLFTLPFHIAVLLLVGKNKKRCVQIVAVAALAFLLIKGALYPALGVEKPGRRLVETMGLPMTVISTVAKENPNCLDERSRAFIDAVATPEEWQKFSTGSFNSNKWAVNLDAIEAAGAGTLLHTAWNCFTADPGDAFASLFTLTKMVYSLDGSDISRIQPHVSDPIPGPFDWYRANLRNDRLRETLEAYRAWFEGTPLKYATLIGTVQLVLLAVLLGRTDFKSWADWKRAFLCLPLFLHNFGTMLLLSGNDYRFFYLSFLVCPPLLFLLLSSRDGAGGTTPENRFHHESCGSSSAAKKETT